MIRSVLRGALFVFAVGSTAISAQMIVHAVTGTVTVKNDQGIFLKVDDDTTNQFDLPAASMPRLSFPAELRTATKDASKVAVSDQYVLMYYYGYGNQRTAISTKDLGPGPFVKAAGRVAGYDKHTRMVTVRTDAGKELTLTLSDELVVDADSGVSSGHKYSPHKGDHIRVTYSSGATPTVVFLHESL